MVTSWLRIAVVVGAVGLPAVAAAQGVQRVAWLQGCWQMTAGDRVVEEQWSSPRAGSMLGVGRTTRGYVLADYEFVIIQERGNRLVYIAHPSGQATAEFLSTTITDGAVVFENPEHDFPQRVGYRRQGRELAAWVEGARGGQTRRIDFLYQAVACAAS